MWAFEREAMIKDEGSEEGIGRVNQLNRKLLAASRTEDLIKSTEDSQYQEELFREFGI